MKKSDVAVSDSKVMKFADWLTNCSVEGIGPLSSSSQLAKEYQLDKSYADDNARVDALIKWEMAKNFGVGFLTGLGGLVVLPISIPSSMLATWAVQARMVGAIAEIYGHSVAEDRVKTAIILCLVGEDIVEILREVGIEVGKKVAKNLVNKIPGKLIQKINKLVGFRLLTKNGEKGIINLTKMVPFVSGPIGGTIDMMACRKVGKIAKKVFAPDNQK